MAGAVVCKDGCAVKIISRNPAGLVPVSAMSLSGRTSALLRLIAFVCFTVASASANEVLFIGNSFTHGQDTRLSQHGGVPAVFQAIARAKGEDVNATMMAASGKDWGFHLRNKATLEMIGSKKWDAVVLQDYSTKPTRIGNRKSFFKHGQDFCELVWKSNPEATIVLYRTCAEAGP